GSNREPANLRTSEPFRAAFARHQPDNHTQGGECCHDRRSKQQKGTGEDRLRFDLYVDLDWHSAYSIGERLFPLDNVAALNAMGRRIATSSLPSQPTSPAGVPTLGTPTTCLNS